MTAATNRLYKKYLPNIQKRDGRVVPFEFGKVVNALERAFLETKEGTNEDAADVASLVAAQLVSIARAHKNFVPTVEGCQDEVERQLMASGFAITAKSYIIYRANRAKLRDAQSQIPEYLRELAKESAKYFVGNPLGEFVYLRTYARWIDKEKRREHWIETVDRYVGFMQENLGDKLTKAEYTELREAILNQKVMPSMRAMQFSGVPAKRCNTCLYNCAFIAPSKLRDFADIMYLSMQGVGVGYAVECWNVEKLPQIVKQSGAKLEAYCIHDSKEGWCDALVLGLKTWYEGKDIEFHYDLIRPAGARLKTMGGKASGPEPLRSLLTFARETILKRQGRRMRPIDVHDLICKIGECVVAGGVRRTAMISLSDLDDGDLRDAKKGQFFRTHPHRSVANNSAVYESKPSNEELMDEWVALMKSETGERGIFNRGALPKQLPKRRLEHHGGDVGQMGTNPCGEILLAGSGQFCNLSEVVARSDDTEETLVEKIKLATILGTYQASLTDFHYIDKAWKQNCEAERLLGVSITGQWDCPHVRCETILDRLKATAIATNKRYAKRFGINEATAITCVKPSGTVSQTLNCSSGMHPRHSPFYIRRVRISSTDALFKMLADQGVPYHPEVGQTMEGANTFVLEFPIKSPGKVFKDDQTAVEQLDYWKMWKEHYTEHNPSATISVGEDEWIGVAAWVYENWDLVGGLTFLPRSSHAYLLPPYEAITKERYDELAKSFPEIDYAQLLVYERTDETEQAREAACAGGACEI